MDPGDPVFGNGCTVVLSRWGKCTTEIFSGVSCRRGGGGGQSHPLVDYDAM